MTDVKVYSTPACPWCKKTKEWLAQNKIAFENIDVSADRKAAEEMIEKSGQMGVPVVEIDGTVIRGYDVPAMKKSLKMSQEERA